MKKFIVLFFLLLVLVGMVQKKQSQQIGFKIYYDSNQKASYDLKYHVQQVFNDLVSNVDQQYYEVMLKDNLNLFSFENCKVKYQEGIVLIQGDGNGQLIEGELIKYQTCMPSVKPKSLIVEFMDN